MTWRQSGLQKNMSKAQQFNESKWLLDWQAINFCKNSKSCLILVDLRGDYLFIHSVALCALRKNNFMHIVNRSWLFSLCPIKPVWWCKWKIGLGDESPPNHGIDCWFGPVTLDQSSLFSWEVTLYRASVPPWRKGEKKIQLPQGHRHR